MSVVDCITSFVDGRVRLRHPALKNKETSELIASFVGGVEGISAVQANPVTGSLLIYYDPEQLTREQLLALAEQGAAFIPGMNKESGEPAGNPDEAPSSQPCRACAPVDELLQLLSSRGTTKFVNRAMLVALAASLAGLPLGSRFLHTTAGGVFMGGMLQHLLTHRKAL